MNRSLSSVFTVGAEIQPARAHHERRPCSSCRSRATSARSASGSTPCAATRLRRCTTRGVPADLLAELRRLRVVGDSGALLAPRRRFGERRAGQQGETAGPCRQRRLLVDGCALPVAGDGRVGYLARQRRPLADLDRRGRRERARSARGRTQRGARGRRANDSCATPESCDKCAVERKIAARQRVRVGRARPRGCTSPSSSRTSPRPGTAGTRRRERCTPSRRGTRSARGCRSTRGRARARSGEGCSESRGP